MGKADHERERRLAEALRQNLRRRKAQSRGSAEEELSVPDLDEPKTKRD
jgi:hypothetical protein